MARVVFDQHLARFIEAPEVHTGAPTLRGALEAACAANPRLALHVLDEHGQLNAQVVVFIDGHRVRDCAPLDAAVGATSEVRFMRALGPDGHRGGACPPATQLSITSRTMP